MADKEDSGMKGSDREEKQTKQLMRQLEGWREVLLPLHCVLIWEKPYYPAVLASVVTLIFLLLWYSELTILTTISLLGLIACLMDYVVPILCRSFCDPDKWRGAQESQFQGICKEMVRTYNYVCDTVYAFLRLKESSPKVYFISVLLSLVLVAWIGNMINNLFLTYMTVLGAVLFPGLKHNASIQKHATSVMSLVKSKLKQKKK